MSDKPRIGDPVFYYANGVTSYPMLGIVVDAYSSDLLKLAVWENERFVVKGSVHHKDSGPVKNNPQIATNFGVWDHRDPPEVRNAISDLVYGKPAGEPPKSKDAKAPAKV